MSTITEQSTLRRRFGLAAKWLGSVVLITGLTGVMYEQVGERRDHERLPQIGRSVDIGGRSLNIFCSGEGSPAVILESGAGDPGYAWSEIQPEIAKFTEACWFDRAGDGWSDPGPFPRTSAAMSAELHQLLHRAGVPPPYVLVGHSLGGLNARVYNGMYPDDVAGAVLVEPLTEMDSHWTQKAGRGGEPSRVTPCNSNRPGRNRTCNPRFWSAIPATPALQRLLIFNDLAPSEQRRRCWTTPALALSLTLCGITPSPILLGASTLCFLPHLMSGSYRAR